ncbi:neuronal acetylcholine receptor subunit alpha-6-like [Saccostrea cucullata]|uniref:neuronal acetylcholine receptor subunit alpha-6-like n=1 Tax=Saccostrea cuccullata TaxID=36930 RepID=UPI002ED40F57
MCTNSRISPVFICVSMSLLTFCHCQRNRSLNLYKHLLDPERYDPSIMPNCGEGDHVAITIEMALRDIVEIDEKQQLIRLKIWIRLEWKDCMLQWDPSSYQNRTELVVPYSSIWIPDITLYEGVSDEGNMPHMDVYRASIKHTGNVMYMFPSIVTIACQFNVAYFPFDHQICSMKIGSWIYSAKNIEMKSIRNDVDISSFRTHNEWDIVGSAAVAHNVYYGCCPEPYSDVTFHIHIRRKPLFYVITIIFPCFLINLLSFMGFVLPSFSAEKISLQVTVLLSVTVFLLLVQDKFPSVSENFPLLAMYFAICMVLVCISCIFSSIVLHVYYRSSEEHEISPLIYSMCLDKCRKMLCIKFDNILKPVKSVGPREEEIRFERHGCWNCSNLSSENEIPMCSSEEIPEYSSDVRQQSNRHDCHKCHVTNEWELIACVLDRLFMFIYICLTMINSIVFFIIIWNYEERDIPTD